MDQDQLCERVMTARDEVVRVKQRRGECGCDGACTSCAGSSSVARNDLHEALQALDRHSSDRHSSDDAS